jgi:hypothetical protein
VVASTSTPLLNAWGDNHQAKRSRSFTAPRKTAEESRRRRGKRTSVQEFTHGGLHMSTMIREQDGFITIYDHYSRRLMMIELYGLQKKISRETWPDAASAKEAFYAGEFTWDESGA